MAIFLVMVASGVSLLLPTSEQVLPWGADFGPSTMQGEPWRLLTSAFLHLGVLHLAVNMYSLWKVGRLAEALYGRWAFAGVYLLSALGGSLCSIIWSPLGVSIGASGAIFGVVGALLAFAQARRGAIRGDAIKSLAASMLSFVGYNFFIGLMLPFIDNAAHAGGLAFGFLSGFAALRLRDGGLIRRCAVVAALALALVGGGVAAHQRVYWNPAVESDRLAQEAHAQFEAGDQTGGLEKMNRAVALAPEYTDRYELRGYMNEVLGHRANAIADYTRVLSAEPDRAHAWLRRAALRFEEGALDEAIHDAGQALSVDPRTSLAHLIRSRVHMTRGEWEQARDEATKEIELAEYADLARLERGTALVNLGKLEAAMADFEPVLEAGPGLAEYGRERRALVYYRQQKYEVALAEIEESLRANPSIPAFSITHGVVLDAKGDLAGALAAYERAVTLDPASADALNNVAWVLHKMGRFDEAIAHATRAIELAPEHAYATGTRCFARFGKGDEGGALADCTRAVELNPKSLADQVMLCLLRRDRSCALRLWNEDIAEHPEHAAELAPYIERAKRGR